MFEKDVLQLIRGLRAHKGHEREYVQTALRECRKEIKTNDMDAKATALMKLVYLEMFGHDMGWASFNVLEVMSSAKYLHKRVGYLAAVQSFRPDTEVLMLAENLLKKDLTSPDKNLISLPLGAIPHVVNPSMANSLLSDLLSRVSHSSPAIRKKAIVTLYRLAVVYPETLRPAWPKIKERLLDDSEDPSVTAAIVNVVCELGWRRPQDFLPLAPRLFELLTQGGNNWMAIKIIKLFSQLTPLEPRLVKKLLPPLTSLIKTTPAMSLLYECINGIIQGGIMEAAGGTTEGDEIARLCVSKLRAMLVVQGDPNLRYVALLAIAKITASHADLVADHQDVILECIDDADISIRTRALDLVIGMVNSNNLQAVVQRLLKQLKTACKSLPQSEAETERVAQDGIIPMADDDEGTAMSVPKNERRSDQPPPLPEDYRILVIERIIELCSKDSYANMDDFDWYISVLVDLVDQCPPGIASGSFGSARSGKTSVSDAIGAELLNVAVRVKGVRADAATAAQSLLLIEQRESTGSAGVLGPAAFIAGEYAQMLPDPEAVLTSMLHAANARLPAEALSLLLHAIPKIFTVLTSDQQSPWTEARRSHVVLLVARVVHFLEPLTLHPSLEVQERAVEYLDLMRLVSEASSNHSVEPIDGSVADPPLLLTQAIPSLFTGIELKPVAPAAIRNVPQPGDFDLDLPINSSLHIILASVDYETDYEGDDNEVRRFYHEKPSAVKTEYNKSASERLESTSNGHKASKSQDTESLLDPQALERKRLERRERYRDDPYYIDSERASGTSTPIHSILRSQNGDELDVDAIPVMELDLGQLRDARGTQSDTDQSRTNKHKPAKRAKRHFEITSDETLGGDDETAAPAVNKLYTASTAFRPTKSLLQMDSSALASLSMDETSQGTSKLDFERRQQEEEEMIRAVKEVERLRLQMQRQAEQIEEPEAEGTVVKSRRKKKVRVGLNPDQNGEAENGEVTKKRKKKKKPKEGNGDEPVLEPAVEDEPLVEEGETQAKVKKKKKRQVTFED
ncbi:hypothetical protein B0A48_05884 [Cryoendolithus antarcticus]|uniref:AP-3 complex subunit delta n=1 Tax=Cryoendolithus antarcticus TaxID=1507870 RepID=A0A1V8TCI5_9PEZI|nr:hypothetical protein B0A48_05884 [Cryoendolithus antarcticus]